MNYTMQMGHQFSGHHDLRRLLRSVAAVFFGGVYATRYLLAIVIFAAVICSPALSPLASSPVASALTEPQTVVVTRSDAETYYVQAVNQIRAANKLPALVIDTRLSTSAQQKTTDMISQNYWAHYAPNGTSFADYVWAASPDAYRVGENLARCYATKDETFAALVASPTHYEIMNGEFSFFGVAELTDPATGCSYTTMHFSYYK